MYSYCIKWKIYPNASYPADIARNIGIAPTNVLSELRGMELEDKKEDGGTYILPAFRTR